MASYSVKVSASGSVEPGTNLESEDTTRQDDFRNTIIDGAVVNAPDTWLYDGDILDLNVPSGFALDINGNRVNPTEVLEYYGTKIVLTSPSDIAYENIDQYQFTAEGRIFKTPGDTGEGNDSITEVSDGVYQATGKAGNGAKDMYWVLGGFDKSRTSINESQWTVEYDGSETTVAGLPDAGSSGSTGEPPELGNFVVNGEVLLGTSHTTQVGDEITVAVTEVSDPDGDFAAPLHWQVNDSGPSNDGPNISVTYDSAGESQITVTANDTQGNTTTQTLDVTVEEAPDPNEPPVLGDFVVNGQTPPSSIEAGEQVTVALTRVSDPDGNFAGPLEWSANNGQTGTGPDFTTSWASPGTAEVTVTAYDAEGLSTSQTLTMEVKDPNKRPNAVINVSVNNETVTLDGSASTDDQGITAYEWSVGPQNYTGQQVSDTFSPGTYNTTLLVRDANGETDTASTTFTVEEIQQTNLGLIAGLAVAGGYLVSRNRDN